MPFSSGTYSAPSSPGAFNPATGGQQATPVAWNALLADLSAALSTAVLKDGTQTVTADIPFNNHKLTGVADGTAAADAATVGQVAAGALGGVNDTGAANAYVITPTPAVLAYAPYQTFRFKAANANSGTSTLNVSGLGVKTIKQLDGADLLTGDIIAGAIVEVVYDGTNFQLVSATAIRGMANTWRADQIFTEAVSVSDTLTMSGAALNGAVRVDVASAATCDIGAAASNYVRITGTTTITSLGTLTGGWRFVLFQGALTLTHSAALLLPNDGNNITTAANDTAIFVATGSLWRCVAYQRASGKALDTGNTSTTDFLGSNVAMNNTANYFTGPSVAVPSGTTSAFASGTVTVKDTAGGARFYAKLWDGTTVIASTMAASAAVNDQIPIALSGRILNPAGNIRISVRDATSTNGQIVSNDSGNSRDSTITVIKLL